MENNEYYSQVFHEMKNSVTLINSYLQFIEKTHPEIAGFDYWDTSKNETARLRAITTELSQVKLGSQLVLESVDLRSFITDCCYGFSCSRDQGQLSYTLNFPEQPLPVLIDPRQFRHAMVNLLKNSCEAMAQKGTVTVEGTLTDADVIIRITDSGCGISPDLIGHVFEPFMSTKESGSGLGLNITRQIILAHCGTITVDSPEGQGCTFTLTLPRAMVS